MRRLPWLCSPEQAFVSLFAADPCAYWLDSSIGASPRARYSFMGGSSAGGCRIVAYPPGPGRAASTAPAVAASGLLTQLRALLDEIRLRRSDDGPPFVAGLVGYLAYEMKAEFGAGRGRRLPYPAARFLLTPVGIAFDQLEKVIHLTAIVDSRRPEPAWIEEIARRLARASREPAALPDQPRRAVSPFRSSLPHRAYLQAFEACRQALSEGESYEICLTMQLAAESGIDPLRLHRVLRRINPAPHAAFMRFGEMSIVSSSPERFLSVGGDGQVEARPIKGTAPRDADPDRDRLLAEGLRLGDKARAENLMIADLLRNDLARICSVGSVQASELLAVESFANVHQLVSTIQGVLRPDADALDALAAAFPPGSMTGAPKLRTMEIIDRLEPCARGVYSGCLGYLDAGGGADLSVVIRTLVQNGMALSCGTGGAVTADSDPESEYAEAMLKASPLLEAVARAGGVDLLELTADLEAGRGRRAGTPRRPRNLD
ncbi:MAG: aminodeoxychorismate synthase component I [Gaiellaceae bacterium]